MKLWISVLTAVIAVSGLAFAKTDVPMSVSLDQIPSTIEEFIAMRDEIAGTPSGGAAMFVAAMINYSKDQALGLQCFTAIMVNDGSLLGDDPKGYGGKSPNKSAMYLIDQLKKYPYLPNSYINGTTVDDGYTLPSAPYTVTISTNKYSANNIAKGEIKIFVATTGGNMPRPVTLVVNNKGIWKVKEFSSLMVGLSKVPVNNDDDL
ncbi:MAG: hypothetical protein HPY53_13840 [Brevinematales bacterium]|nr:hypothetical protein [Brevinematales bacterium]